MGTRGVEWCAAREARRTRAGTVSKGTSSLGAATGAASNLNVPGGIIGSVVIGGAAGAANSAGADDQRGQPDMEAPRSEIRAIRYYPTLISFRGADDEPVMEPEPHWTVRQMLKVAEELGVPLYNHKGTLGLEELSVGRLAYDPRQETGDRKTSIFRHRAPDGQ